MKKRLLNDYGMLLALLVLCLLFSGLTYTEQHPTGSAAARSVASVLAERDLASGANVFLVGRDQKQDIEFTQALSKLMSEKGVNVLATINGEPSEARKVIRRFVEEGASLDAILGTDVTAKWLAFEGLEKDFPSLGNPAVLGPKSYKWPNFLKRDNLLNISSQISVIAILAIGMTVVIITAGIDLSVGSLIALAAVLSAYCMKNFFGAEEAGFGGMVLSSCVGILACGFVGLFTGWMVTRFKVPPFIVTLGMMLVASGLSYIVAGGLSIHQIPDSFVWLGRGADLVGIPNSVVLMLILYVGAHVMMSKTKVGRYIYAVGGNAEAARLSGVPVKRVLLFAYCLSGLLAGLGGIVMASQLQSGSATYGLMYELYTIAAVVVGGASLAGGEGRMFGTLIGAFIIAVIWNGMNLTNVEPYTQKVVLGFVILGAVLLDRLKRGGWKSD